MAESQVTICNKALAHIGISAKISAITDDNNEADECQKAYDSILDVSLGKADWAFARRLFTLVIAAGTAPDPWTYQYTYPTDVVKALRIDDLVSSRQSKSRIPFTYITTAAGRLLLTNVPDAKLWYTHRETNVAIYPHWFIGYLSFALAAEIVMPLTKSEKLADKIKVRSIHAMAESIALDLENEQEDPEPEAGWIDFRDGPLNRSKGVAAHDFDYFS